MTRKIIELSIASELTKASLGEIIEANPAGAPYQPMYSMTDKGLEYCPE